MGKRKVSSPKRSILLAGIMIWALSLLTFGCGQASQSTQGDFPVKDITLVVPYSPGGGYDTLARGLAPYLEKYLPNGIRVIVENRQGAAGQTGTNYVYNADPDGYTITLTNIPGLMAGQVIGANQTYDLTEFTWLGRVAVVQNGLAVAADSPYQSVDDLVNKGSQILFAGSDVGDAATALIAFSKMGLQVRYLPHNGSGEAVTSVLRGDGDITYFSLSSLLPYIESGDLRVLVQYAPEGLEGLDAPVVGDLGYPELAEIAVQQRVIGAPPGVPDEVKNVLEQALEQAVQDPEFQEWSQSINQPAAWLSGEQTANIVNESAQLIDEYRDVLVENLGAN